jgi:multisubunit Na+/H+ antiporter MnhC subunit
MSELDPVVKGFLILTASVCGAAVLVVLVCATIMNVWKRRDRIEEGRKDGEPKDRVLGRR